MIKENLNEYKKEFKKCINDLKNKKTIYKQIPNLITIARPIGMIPANILFFTGHPISAIILTGLLLATDLIDGKLARRWNVQSKLGADLDAVGDKIMFLGMALPIIASNPIMIINVLLEGAISYVNVLGKVKGFDPKTVYSGKVKTWFLSASLLTGYLSSIFGVSNTIFKILVGLTCISQGITLSDYIIKYNETKKLKEDNTEIKNSDEEILLEEETEKEPNDLVEQLKKEREFLLSTKKPNKVYTGKKRIRTIFEEKKNNNHPTD